MSDVRTADRRATRTLDARQERRLRWLVRGGVAVIRVLAATWRIRVVDYGPIAAARREGRPLVFSLWHGELLPLLWQHRGEGVRVLISEHRDGELVARAAEALGYRTVRGSTSRGGGRALLELVRVLREGSDIAVTPDGPRGPARRFAPGAIIAAQRAGAPIVCVAVHAPRAWRLRSWDRFVIPKPFARLTIAYAEPTFVQADTVREAAGEAARFEALHEAAAARAAAAHDSPDA